MFKVKVHRISLKYLRDLVKGCILGLTVYLFQKSCMRMLILKEFTARSDLFIQYHESFLLLNKIKIKVQFDIQTVK